jgi:gas vesicle protein
MRSDASSTRFTLLLALLGGAAIGGLVVALSAPRTGRELRKTIRDAARRLSRRPEELDEVDNGTIDALFI